MFSKWLMINGILDGSFYFFVGFYMLNVFFSYDFTWGCMVGMGNLMPWSL
jgi:hypothetical protein